MAAKARDLLERGDVYKSLDEAEAALKKANNKKDVDEAAEALEVIVAVSVAKNEIDEAEDAVKEQLQIYRSSGDKKGQAYAFIQMSSVLLAKGQVDKAGQMAGDAVSFAKQMSAPKVEGRAISVRAKTQLTKGESGSGIVKDGNQALALAQEFGDSVGEAAAWCIIAEAHLTAGDEDGPSDALLAAKKGADVYKKQGWNSGEGHAQNLAARAQLMLGRAADALTAAKASYKAWKACGNRKGSTGALEVLCEAHCAAQSGGEALKLAHDELVQCQKGQDRRGSAGILQVLAKANHLFGDNVEAFRTAKEARSLFRELKDKQGEAWMTHQIAEIQVTMEQKSEALRSAQEALGIFKSISSKVGEQAANRTISNLMAAMGKVEKCPDRKEGFQALKEMNRAIRDRDAEAFGKAQRKLALVERFLAEFDIQDGLSQAFEEDEEGTKEFLKEQGWTFQEDIEKEKAESGPQTIRVFDHHMFYVYNRTAGGMGFGPQFRSVHPHRVGKHGESLECLGALCLPETEYWQHKMDMFRGGIMDGGIQIQGVLGWPPYDKC